MGGETRPFLCLDDSGNRRACRLIAGSLDFFSYKGIKTGDAGLMQPGIPCLCFLLKNSGASFCMSEERGLFWCGRGSKAAEELVFGEDGDVELVCPLVFAAGGSGIVVDEEGGGAADAACHLSPLTLNVGLEGRTVLEMVQVASDDEGESLATGACGRGGRLAYLQLAEEVAEGAAVFGIAKPFEDESRTLGT